MKLISLLIICLCFSSKAVVLVFNPNPEAVSYVLHYGTNSGVYLISTNIGNVTNFTLANSNLFVGTNYLAVGAVNGNGVEFDLSNEIGYRVWPANLHTTVKLALESSGDPTGPWKQVASLSYADAALTNRFYRGKVYLQ